MSKTDTHTQITGVGTIGVPVADQDRSLAFYAEKLGFETRLDAPFGEGQRWIEVAPPGSVTTIALALARDGFPSGVDTGLRLSTNDAAADHAALRERGVDVDPEIIPYPVPMFTFRDPDGNRLYIVERPPEV
jgi:catechol 2,3-dioxygenase-like lactoylglutathione lyase family enzyme